MAFKLRVGATNMPQPGNQISVYHTGTTDLVDPIFSPDGTQTPISNPFITPSSGWYGFEPPSTNRVDVYWHEGEVYLLENANVRDSTLDVSTTMSDNGVVYYDEDEHNFLSTNTGTVGQVLTVDESGTPIWEDLNNMLPDPLTSGHIINKDETVFPQRSTLTFTGSVSVSDDENNNQTIVNILGGSGGGGSSDISIQTTSNDAEFPVLFVSSTLTQTATLSKNGNHINFNPSTGMLTSTGFNAMSDEKYKTNVIYINPLDSLNIVNLMSPVEFDWKESKLHSSGVIAQQLETVLPHLVNNTMGVKSVNYDGIIAYLIGAIQCLSNKIQELENK